MKKGLLITFYFPPLNSVASHRLYSFARYLNHENGSLDVLCPDIKGDLNYDLNGMNIIRIPEQPFDLNYGKTKVGWLGKIKNFILNGIFKRNYFRSAEKNKFYKDAVKVLSDLDLSVYDYFITSYGPLDSLHIGKWIKQKFPDKIWIVDYRDLYSLMEYYNFGIYRPFFRKKEKSIVIGADYFITVSNTLLHLQKKLLGINGEVIYNGFESSQYHLINDKNFMDQLDEIKLPVISYTGSLYGGERDAVPFLKYFMNNQLDQKYCLVFALINDVDQIYLEKYARSYNIKNLIILRNLSYDNSIALQNKSQILLLLANFGMRANGYLTGKIFEYIGAEKPILYSGNDSNSYELYAFIKENNFGDSFTKFDFNNTGKYKGNRNEMFSRKLQAKKLDDRIDQLLSER